jgi:hypothetical protein
VDGDPGESIGYVRTLAVGLVAALDEADAVLGEVTQRVDNGVHSVHGWDAAASEISRPLLRFDETTCCSCAGFARASGSVVSPLLLGRETGRTGVSFPADIG